MNIMRIMKKTQILTLILISLLCSATNVSAVSNSQDVDVEFTIENAIQITTSGSLTISDLLPGASGQSSAATVSVVTNSAGGYILSATVGGASNATTSLTNSNVSTAFAMVSDDVSGIANLSNNTWGISIDSGSTFISLPLYTSSAKTLKSDSSAAASSSLSLLIGAKAASSVESGTYANVINFTAVTQAPVTGIASISTMQEMTASICEDTETPLASAGASTPQYSLKDTRDNKYYYVAKLADGNCWMTQNLDLDITTAGLTNADTDLNSKTAWNSGSTYAPQATQTTISSSTTQTDTYSWSLGDYAYNGTTNSSCGTSATSYADCTSYGFSTTSSPTAGANHYHVGNLYQWNAATAGSGGTITSGQAQDSICPKGWRLPTSTGSGEFQALVTTYSAGSTVQTLLNSPLYFVRGGYVFSGTLRLSGYYGFYWSSTPRSNSSYAYNLYFSDTSNVDPSGNYYSRYFGFSVRCVAR